MAKKLIWEWERLDESTWRAKVIGGWLVLHTNSVAITDGKKREVAQSESMAFIADREHTWPILKPVEEVPGVVCTVESLSEGY